jgi:hypothetical protein
MIIVVGDVHGRFNEFKIGVRNILNETQNETEPINFVQVGDFGLGFKQPGLTFQDLADLDNDLILRNSHVWVIRGNHDNPAFWNPSTGYRFQNIHFVQDDSILELDGKQCYFAGGAISIDRIARRNGVDYWASETYSHKQKVIDNPIDLIFTHDVYQEISNFSIHTADIVKSWIERDKFLYADLLAQQYELKCLYENISLNTKTIKWYHGHYHQSSICYYDNDSFTCGLAELEFKEIH